MTSVPTGPFTVVVPIAARYDELQKAMGMLFTDGKYFFSKEYPALYLENPEIYESQGQIVLKVEARPSLATVSIVKTSPRVWGSIRRITLF